MAQKRTLKQSLRLDLDDLLKMNVKELRDVYRQLGKVTRSRVATFERHGAEKARPIKRVKDLPKSPGGFKKRELARKIFEQQLFLSGDESTFAKYRKKKQEFRKMMERKTGMKFRTVADYEKYRKFMDDIEERWKSLPFWYLMAKRLYTQIERVGFDVKNDTFSKNFMYWSDQIEKLESITDAQVKKFRRKKKADRTDVKALLKEFGLPPIPEDSNE